MFGAGVLVDRCLVVAVRDTLAGGARGFRIVPHLEEVGATARESPELRSIHIAKVLHRRAGLVAEIDGLRQVEGRDMDGAVGLHAGTIGLFRLA